MTKVEEFGNDEAKKVVLSSEDESELERAVELYLLDYPSNAYMTRRVDAWYGLDDRYYVSLWRRASCD